MLDWLRQVFATYNVPGYGIFLLILLALIKTWPIIQKNLLDARENRESRYGTRIKDLEAAVEKCREECEEHKTNFREEIRNLEDTIAGMRRQHLQEQISLVSAIIGTVDNPLLKQMLMTLQTVQRTLPSVRLEERGEVLGDKAKTPK